MAANGPIDDPRCRNNETSPWARAWTFGHDSARQSPREEVLDAIQAATIATSPGANQRFIALPDLVVEAEDRKVHRDHDEADDASDEDDHDRLDQGGQRLDLGVDLGLVEVGDF